MGGRQEGHRHQELRRGQVLASAEGYVGVLALEAQGHARWRHQEARRLLRALRVLQAGYRGRQYRGAARVGGDRRPGPRPRACPRRWRRRSSCPCTSRWTQRRTCTTTTASRSEWVPPFLRRERNESDLGPGLLPGPCAFVRSLSIL